MSVVPFCVDGTLVWLSLRGTEGILGLTLAPLPNEGILLNCLTDSCPFSGTVGSLFSLAESGLLCCGAEDGILLAGFSFCEVLSLRPTEGICDFLTVSCPLSALLRDGILLLGGVRSSAPFCFAREGIRDGIFDISELLTERQRVSSIELFDGDLISWFEGKLLLLDDRLMLPTVFSEVTTGLSVLDWPLGRTISLFSRLKPDGERRLVKSLVSRWRPAGDFDRGLDKPLSCLRLAEEFDRAGLGIEETLAGDCARRGLATISLFSRRRLPFLTVSCEGRDGAPPSALDSLVFLGVEKLALLRGRTGCLLWAFSCLLGPWFEGLPTGFTMRALLWSCAPFLTCINNGYLLEGSSDSWQLSGAKSTISLGWWVLQLPFDTGDRGQSSAVSPLQTTPFKCLASVSLCFLSWLKSPDLRLKLGRFLSPTSLWLLLTFFGSEVLLGGAGLNWGTISTGVRPKLGPAPKIAEALRPLHDDGSGRLKTK